MPVPVCSVLLVPVAFCLTFLAFFRFHIGWALSSMLDEDILLVELAELPLLSLRVCCGLCVCVCV